MFQRIGKHPLGHRRIKQAEIDQISIDGIEPLAGLGQHLEAARSRLTALAQSPIRHAWAPASSSRVRLSWSSASTCPIAIVKSRSSHRTVPSARKSRAVVVIPSLSTSSGPVGSQPALNLAINSAVGS